MRRFKVKSTTISCLEELIQSLSRPVDGRDRNWGTLTVQNIWISANWYAELNLFSLATFLPWVLEDETQNGEINTNWNPEWWGDVSHLLKSRKSNSRYLTVQSRIEILIGFEFRGISRYKFKLRFLSNLNLQLIKISPPFRISICISALIIGLFCGKWPLKIRHPMTLRHTVVLTTL